MLPQPAPNGFTRFSNPVVRNRLTWPACDAFSSPQMLRQKQRKDCSSTLYSPSVPPARETRFREVKIALKVSLFRNAIPNFQLHRTLLQIYFLLTCIPALRLAPYIYLGRRKFYIPSLCLPHASSKTGPETENFLLAAIPANLHTEKRHTAKRARKAKYFPEQSQQLFWQ